MNRLRDVLLLLASLGSLTAACGCRGASATGETPREPPRQLEIEAVAVQRAPLRAELELVGTLIPLRATTIVSEVDGVIQSFPCCDRTLKLDSADSELPREIPLGLDNCHQVRQGEVLVQIDPVDFQLALKAAEAELELAKRNLDKLLSWRRPEEEQRLKAALAEAEAADERARADLKRAEQLFARQAISKEKLDSVVMAARTAAAAVAQADAALRLYLAGPTKAEIAVAEAQVAAAEARVALQREKLAKTVIRAPYDGVITERYVDVGDRVTAMPRVEIMQIVEPRILFAEVAVPERFQGRVHLDDQATVIASGNRTLAAKVDLINAKIDPQTRTFRVRVTIDNTKRLLKPGGFVEVRLPVASVDAVPVVPVEAIVYCEGRPAVFVYREGHVYRTPVELGICDLRRSEVSRLTEGQLVAVSGTALLADGLPVRLKHVPAAGEPQGGAGR